MLGSSRNSLRLFSMDLNCSCSVAFASDEDKKAFRSASSFLNGFVLEAFEGDGENEDYEPYLRHW